MNAVYVVLFVTGHEEHCVVKFLVLKPELPSLGSSSTFACFHLLLGRRPLNGRIKWLKATFDRFAVGYMRMTSSSAKSVVRRSEINFKSVVTLSVGLLDN
jgi:hypothetical protein